MYLEQSILIFKVCKSMHHHTIQINQPTRCNNFSRLLLVFMYNSTGQLARPQPTAMLPPRSNGKPEAATAVVELLMMGVRTPKTC
jgi:hypothetical protein